MIEIKVTYASSLSKYGLSFQLGQRDDTNAWIVMRDTTPMFCFEAETKEEAISKADAAIVFYHENELRSTCQKHK